MLNKAVKVMKLSFSTVIKFIKQSMNKFKTFAVSATNTISTIKHETNKLAALPCKMITDAQASLNDLTNDELIKAAINVTAKFDQLIIKGIIASLLVITTIAIYIKDKFTKQYTSTDAKPVYYFPILLETELDEVNEVLADIEEVIIEVNESVTDLIKIEAVEVVEDNFIDDENEIELTNMEEFLTAIENHFNENANKVSDYSKTIEYKAIKGRKCRKGYRRVGDACVLISYINAINKSKTISK